MKKAMKLISDIITILIVIVIIMSLYSMVQYRKNPDKPPAIFGYSTMSVLTGSMRPYMEPGDMIVDKMVEADEIGVGDVITYHVGSSIVTHRVVKIVTEDGKPSFVTRGDANNTEDGNRVTNEQLIGKVVFRIPYGGYVARFIRSPLGLTIIVFIAIFLMFAAEVKNMLSGSKKKDIEKTDPKTV